MWVLSHTENECGRFSVGPYRQFQLSRDLSLLFVLLGIEEGRRKIQGGATVYDKGHFADQGRFH